MSTLYNGQELRELREGKVRDKYAKYIGESFGSLRIESIAGTGKHSIVIVNAICECGNSVLRSLTSILKGRCISCGCKNKTREIFTKIGMFFKNNDEELAEVIEVVTAVKIFVRFLSCGTIAEYTQQALINGSFKNRNRRSVYGVGYIGFGQYDSGTHNKIYKRWQSMLQRCYDEAFVKDHPTYFDCSVVDEWHNFQNFASWIEKQPNYNVGVLYHLDKDLIDKGNRVYSPDKCSLLPFEINVLITTSQAARGDLPIGVIWHKKKQEYRAQMTMTVDGVRKNKHILTSDCPLKCFEAYKSYKENHFKFMAEKYKESLTEQAYLALMNRKVEIDD